MNPWKKSSRKKTGGIRHTTSTSRNKTQGGSGESVGSGGGMSDLGSRNEYETEETKLVVYVNAPPPLINPWRINSNTASTISSKSSTVAESSSPSENSVASASGSIVGDKGPRSIVGEDKEEEEVRIVYYVDAPLPVVNPWKTRRNTNSGSVVGDCPSENSVASGSVSDQGTRSIIGEDKEEDDSEESKLMYVDAPPPLVNPWKVNPNAASVIAKKTPVNIRQETMTMKVDKEIKVPAPTPIKSVPSTGNKAAVKYQPATAKERWDINRKKRRLDSLPRKPSGEDWPSLEPTIEEVTDNLTSLTFECKSVQQFDSSSSGSTDSTEWPLISSGGSLKNCISSRKDGNTDETLPSPEPAQSSRQQYTNGDENGRSGNGSSYVSSDDMNTEVKEGSTDEMQTRKTKKSAKLKWVPLKFTETTTPKQRVRKEKSLKFKNSRNERGESPSPGRGRGGRGGPRGRGTGRGSSRNSHQYFFNESSDPNTIPPANPRDDYTDYPPDFTTLAPVFSEVSEFIMPYVADNFYSNSFSQQSDTATSSRSGVSFVPAGLEDALLMELLKQQIEYYFSEENLEKDFYLRRKMDSEGYLPIKLIASFQRVQNMTHDNNIVLSAILSSKILEVKGDMSCVRTMITPARWPIADTLYIAAGAPDFSCPVVPSVNVPNGVVLSEPRSIQAV